MVHKDYSRSPRRVRDGLKTDYRYEPPRDPFITRIPVYGNPDPGRISTSHVERLNLEVRMPVVASSAPAAAVRELPGGRGFLRVVQGGNAPTPKPGPVLPPTPLAAALAAPREPVQLNLFDD